jgi:acyl-CoA thioesterase
MPTPQHPHPSDVDLLHLDVAADRQSGSFLLGSGLVRHDGALYGGTGLAVAVAAMETATDRDALWASTQFVSQPVMGSTIDWTVETLALGKRAAQLSVRTTCDGAVAFAAIGSTGIAVEDGLTGAYAPMPLVSDPDSAPPRAQAMGDVSFPDSWTTVIEMREADVLSDDGPSVAMWSRFRDSRPFTPAAIGFIADFVPLGVARAAGKMGAGSSLDNTMRFRGGAIESDWVLLELRGDFAQGGFGHGTVRVWTRDGTLLATGSQSASMRYLFDEGGAPNPLLPSVGDG